ncbi:hypothetical protein IFT69_15780 [Pseudomonas putida]|nr:hypothetical protein [Pseudomonas putida]
MITDLDAIPAAKDFVAAVRRFFTNDLESIDTEFNALPLDLRTAGLREALVMSFVSQNAGILEWALSRGLDADAMISQDYSLALELSDRLISRSSKEALPQFAELVSLAMSRHGQDLLTDTITAMTLSFSDKDDALQRASQGLSQCEKVLGKKALGTPSCASILFKSVSSRSDHRPLIWDFSRRDYLADNLVSKAVILQVLRAVDHKDRAPLVSLLDVSLAKAISSIQSIDDDEDFLIEVMPHASPAMLQRFVDTLLNKVRPLRHHQLTGVLLHRLGNRSLEHGFEHLQNVIIDKLVSHPTFSELRGSYEPAQLVNANVWSIRSAAKLVSLGHPATIKTFSFDGIIKTLQSHDSDLDEDTKEAMRKILKDELRLDLKKALRTAKKSIPDQGHYLHQLDGLSEDKLMDALACLCEHEQLLVDQTKRGVEDEDIPLLTGARKNVRNPGGNPHYSMRPVFSYLMQGMSDQFKIDLRPKDKKYARALIMAGNITDTRFYSLLTAKERDGKMGTDLGI